MASKRKIKGVIDPNWMKDNRQIARTKMVETMLLQHGFYKHGHTGDHATYKHDLLDNIVTVVTNSSKVVDQITAAKACLEVLEIQEAQRLEAQAAKQKRREENASRAIQEDTRSVKTIDHLPDNIEGYEQDGLVVIRAKRLRSVGDIVDTTSDPEMLATLCEQLDQRAKDMLKRIGEMTREYETAFKIDKKTGDLVLSHPWYGIDVVIPPYDPDESEFLESDVAGFVNNIKGLDNLFQKRLRRIIENYRNDDPKNCGVEISETQGGLEVVFVDHGGIVNRHIRTPLACSPQYRPNPMEFYTAWDRSAEKRMGSLRNPKEIAKAVTRDYGFAFSRPRDPETGELGDHVVVTHPFDPDYEETILAPSDRMSCREICKKYEGEELFYLNPDFIQELEKSNALFRKMQDAFYHLGHVGNNIFDDAVDIAKAELGEDLRKRYNMDQSFNPKRNDMGKVTEISVIDPKTKVTAKIKGIIVKLSKDKSKAAIYLDPNDRDAMRAFAAEVNASVEKGRRFLSERTTLGEKKRGSTITSGLSPEFLQNHYRLADPDGDPDPFEFS